MKNKIRLCVGWLGVLTPVYAAGALTVLFALNLIDPFFIARVVGVSVINCFIGRKLLKSKPILLKVVKENGKKKVKEGK